MLQVTKLTKVYGETTVLDRVSFRVEPGEVVGFLGPNGAGKTTTMRIIAGFIPATSGRASVDGFDSFSRSLSVRRRIGYLPELTPLYPELRVIEYLRYRARLKGISWRRRRSELARVTESCFLAGELTKPIRNLSKGHRHRVGLADALLGDPKLLILDEPTAGLDPNQVIRIRQLIGELAEKHTILLSTHVLPEVEATCSRAIIIHNGCVVAEQDLRALSSWRLHTLDCELVGPGVEIEEELAAIDAVTFVTRRDLGGGAHAVRLRAEEGHDLREAVGREALRCGWVIRELRPVGQSLEDIFVEKTTGEDRRDDPITTGTSPAPRPLPPAATPAPTEAEPAHPGGGA